MPVLIRVITYIAFFLLLNAAHAQICGKVVSVSDGDTFTMLDSNKNQVKIRLHGIDCPEKKQDYGTVATRYLSELIFGKSVSIYISGYDRYGRIIAIVPMGKTTVNEMLLRAGLAWHYCKYDKLENWHKIQDSAYAAKTGLWSKQNAIAPWIFRKTK